MAKKHGTSLTDVPKLIFLKLRCYEMPTKFEKNLLQVLLNHLFLLSSVKTSGRFYQICVAFSEKPDSKRKEKLEKWEIILEIEKSTTNSDFFRIYNLISTLKLRWSVKFFLFLFSFWKGFFLFKFCWYDQKLTSVDDDFV